MKILGWGAWFFKRGTSVSTKPSGALEMWELVSSLLQQEWFGTLNRDRNCWPVVKRDRSGGANDIGDACNWCWKICTGTRLRYWRVYGTAGWSSKLHKATVSKNIFVVEPKLEVICFNRKDREVRLELKGYGFFEPGFCEHWNDELLIQSFNYAGRGGNLSRSLQHSKGTWQHEVSTETGGLSL